ncbi:MAG: response regulator [Desulfobacterales bacterium]|nr:response regulator [Desulfobacterales bacterium]
MSDKDITRTETILIVDDMPQNIWILHHALNNDYKLRMATNGEQALEIANSDNPPDLILLDVMMSGIDGYEVCKRLKDVHSKAQDIPVIFITSLNEAEDKAKGFSLGAVDYISKPVKIVELKARVRTHLDLKRYRDHLEEMVKYRTLELEEAKVRAETANKAKDQFLNNITHELNTPMNAIVASTDLAIEVNPPKKILKYLEIIQASSRILTNIINQLLEFTRKESENKDKVLIPFYLDDVFKHTFEYLNTSENKKNIVFHFKKLTDAIPNALIGDPKKLKTILGYLIDNAIKFSLTDIRIDFFIRAEWIDHHQLMIEFQIRDYGIGINPKYYDQIFEPFFQIDSATTRKFGGTGMGLALCKRLVESMGGRIWVENNSPETQGSTFCFTCKLMIQNTTTPFEWPSSQKIDSLQGAKTVTSLKRDDIDPQKVKSILKTMARFLENMDHDGVMGTIQHLYEIIDETKLNDFIEQIGQYEYDAALKTLSSIASMLNIDLT